MSTDPSPARLPAPIDPADFADEEIHPRDVWAIARFLGPFARPYRRPLFVLAFILIVETFINACFPLATQYLIDEGLSGDEKNLNVVIGVLIFLAAATAVITGMGVVLDY